MGLFLSFSYSFLLFCLVFFSLTFMGRWGCQGRKVYSWVKRFLAQKKCKSSSGCLPFCILGIQERSGGTQKFQNHFQLFPSGFRRFRLQSSEAETHHHHDPAQQQNVTSTPSSPQENNNNNNNNNIISMPKLKNTVPRTLSQDQDKHQVKVVLKGVGDGRDSLHGHDLFTRKYDGKGLKWKKKEQKEGWSWSRVYLHVKMQWYRRCSKCSWNCDWGE